MFFRRTQPTIDPEALPIVRELRKELEHERNKDVRGEWRRDDDDDTWYCSACYHLFTLLNGTPEENELNFCPNCGARMKEAGEGFQAINNRWNVGPSEALRTVGKYRRNKRAEDASKCTNCEWRANGLAICVLPKCFLQN